MTSEQPARAEAGTSAGADLLALDRQVCFALAVASRTVIGLYRPLLEPMGLTHPQYLVMLALWEEEPLRVSEVADRLSLEPATLSPLLKRLEAAGLVVRERDRADERAVAVSLTTAGRRLLVSLGTRATTSSPARRSRAPASRSARTAPRMAATPPFMSHAPRPYSLPSSTSPPRTESRCRLRPGTATCWSVRSASCGRPARRRRAWAGRSPRGAASRASACAAA